MFIRRILPIILLLLPVTPALSAEPCSLAALHFMAGTWVNTDNPSGAQERWVLAPGDVLMGSAWEFPPGKAGYAEVMTIRTDGAAPVMRLRHFDGGLARAWEERETPMEFGATECSTDNALFSGLGSHVGERMRYTRSGDNLLISADFIHHGTTQHVDWHMKRAGE
jgi:hypothetical protein